MVENTKTFYLEWFIADLRFSAICCKVAKTHFESGAFNRALPPLRTVYNDLPHCFTVSFLYPVKNVSLRVAAIDYCSNPCASRVVDSPRKLAAGFPAIAWSPKQNEPSVRAASALWVGQE